MVNIVGPNDTTSVDINNKNKADSPTVFFVLPPPHHLPLPILGLIYFS